MGIQVRIFEKNKFAGAIAMVQKLIQIITPSFVGGWCVYKGLAPWVTVFLMVVVGAIVWIDIIIRIKRDGWGQ